jgi:hypothetical protein
MEWEGLAGGGYHAAVDPAHVATLLAVHLEQRSGSAFVTGCASAVGLVSAPAGAAAPWWAAARDRALWLKRLDGNDVLPDGQVLPNGLIGRFLNADGQLDPVGYNALCYSLRDAHRRRMAEVG